MRHLCQLRLIVHTAQLTLRRIIVAITVLRCCYGTDGRTIIVTGAEAYPITRIGTPNLTDVSENAVAPVVTLITVLQRTGTTRAVDIAGRRCALAAQRRAAAKEGERGNCNYSRRQKTLHGLFPFCAREGHMSKHHRQWIPE